MKRLTVTIGLHKKICVGYMQKYVLKEETIPGASDCYRINIRINRSSLRLSHYRNLPAIAAQ